MIDQIETSKLLLIAGSKKLHEQYIDLSKISDRLLYEKAVEINRHIIRSIKTIDDTVKNIGKNTLTLKFEKLEQSALENAVMRIDKEGKLMIDDSFFLTTGLKCGCRLKPFKRVDDSIASSIYLFEDDLGYKLCEKGINLKKVLTDYNKIFPTRVLWQPVEHQAKKGFELQFINL